MSDGPSRVSKLFGYSRLKGIPDIRTSFRTTEQPVFFVGPTAFSLPGIDRWARNFGDVACCDSRDSGHARVFAPENRPYVEFSSSEEISNYPLREVAGGSSGRSAGGYPPM
jgi:hypothetical protein